MDFLEEIAEEGISMDDWEQYNRYLKYFAKLAPEWGRDGLCYQTHPFPEEPGKPETKNPWFPGHGKHKLLPNVQRMCAACPVREKCFEAGWDDEYGVWGGSGEKQRRDWKETGVTLEEAKVLLSDYLATLGNVSRETP
jgi:hypothetical protein